MRFEGLTVGDGYDLTFYGSRNTTGAARVMYATIDSTTRSYESFVEGKVEFIDVIADANGYITAGFTNAGGSAACHLNAAMLTPHVSRHLSNEVLIDFGPTNELQTVDSLGKHWNKRRYTGRPLVGLVDAGNEATSVNLLVPDSFSLDGNFGVTNSNIVPWDRFVTDDCAFLNAATAQIRFEGLTVGDGYDLTFYGLRNSGDTRRMNVTIDATTLAYNAGKPEGKTTFTNAIADAERGITVSYETIRLWCIKFGAIYTCRLKSKHRGYGDTFYIDEVFFED